MSCYISIDLGGTIVKTGLVRDGKVVASSRIEASSGKGLGPMLEPLARAVDKLVADLHGDSLEGVAMAFPGIVDFDAGRALSTNAKYDDAPSLDMRAWVRRRWNAPFIMDNDARMAMIGEWTYGAGRECRNMVMMTIGTGIGTGVLLDGRPIYGRSGCAGSLGGHLTVDYKGRHCTCGNVGCIEAQASSFFLPQIIREDMRLSAAFRQHPSNYDFKDLAGKYRTGDRDAAMVLESCMDAWSAAVVNYIHAYDPEKVIIGGGVMKSGDIILPYIRERVRSLAWCPAGEVELGMTALGDDAALLAAPYYFSLR